MENKLGDYCGQYLSELAMTNEKIWVLDGDLADSDGAVHFPENHPNRFVMAGIAEQSMISVAAGLASCQMRPFVFSFAAFLCYRAYDQIRVCLSQAKQPVTLIGSHSGGCAGRNGKTHCALNDIALIASLPNFHIWSPADRQDVEFALDEILRYEQPAYIRLPREPLPEIGGDASYYRWLGLPSEVTIVSTGIASHWALKVKEMLARKNIEASVLHLLHFHPLSEKLIAEIAFNSKYLFVLEDHYTLGGVSTLIQHAIPSIRVNALGWKPGWSGKSGSQYDILNENDLSAAQIAEKIDISLNTKHLCYQ